jgi:hypothetical protein
MIKRRFIFMERFFCFGEEEEEKEVRRWRRTKGTELKEVGNTKVTKNHDEHEGAVQLFEAFLESWAVADQNFVNLRGLRVAIFF